MAKERSRRNPAHTITDTDDADDIALLANTPTQRSVVSFPRDKIIIITKWFNSSKLPIGGPLTYSTNPSPSGPGSNGNKWVLYISVSFTKGASLSDTV